MHEHLQDNWRVYEFIHLEPALFNETYVNTRLESTAQSYRGQNETGENTGYQVHTVIVQDHST